MRDSGQYARVNTELAEIDTVRDVDDPEAVWQSGSSTVLFAQGNRQRWDVDAASPSDLLADSSEEGTPLASQPTPAGTRDVLSAGVYVAYRTDTGQVSVSTLAAGAGTALVDPFAEVEVEEGEDPPTYTADAIGLSPDGLLVLYSADEGLSAGSTSTSTASSETSRRWPTRRRRARVWRSRSSASAGRCCSRGRGAVALRTR